VADQRKLTYARRAQKDLQSLEKRFALQILADLPLLEHPPWPPGKVKRLVGTEWWELKTGDYRTIFWPDRTDVVILRVVNRRDLDRQMPRVKPADLATWLRLHRTE